MPIERDVKLLTASDVAELCEVDLKTIHNWVDRGCIPHFRTPGRHLRFQAIDVANFLREWGYAIPRRFYAEIAKAVMVVGGKEATNAVTKAAGQTAAIHTVGDLYDALLRVGQEPTTAVVLDQATIQTHGGDVIVRAVAALKQAYAITVIGLGTDKFGLAEKADILFIPMGDTKMLRAALTGDVKDSAQVEEGVVPPPPRLRTRRVRSPGKRVV
jgi:excisionase family DNA binding protein